MAKLSQLRRLSLDTAADIRSFLRDLKSTPLQLKPVPYVYAAIHKKTMQFYFGFRCANDLPPHEDIGIRYLTSSSTIKRNPEDYHFLVVRTFRSADRAYAFEQKLIKAHIDNVRCLNRHWQKPGTYTMLGMKRPDLAEFNRKTKRVERITHKLVCAHCGSKFDFTTTANSSRKRVVCSYECMGASSRGRTAWNKGLKSNRPAWNKGKSSSTAAENGRKGAAKLSATVTGRKRQYRPDGSWFWHYPT